MAKKQMIYLKETLYYHCVSLNEFSRITGLASNHISRLINGKHRPRLATIKLVAMGLSRIDLQDWQIHANRIKEEINK
tara:strand:- start:621 stop:854 length:234 start_codon:yes stop_codon:yes gene_type:complete